MKKPLSFCFLFVLLSVISLAQTDNINQIDAKGRKQGYWKKYDDNNGIIYEGKFKDGAPVDTFKYYYEGYKDPTLRCIMIFKNGGKESYAFIFHPTGKPMAQGRYLNQLKDSTWTYYDNNGALNSTDLYVKGKRNGVSKVYYEGGFVFSETTYKDSIKNGAWKEYFPEGNVKAEGNYNMGKLEGQTAYYFPDGKVAAKGLYLNGSKHHTWLYFTTKGDLESKEVYNKGNLLTGKAAEEFIKNNKDTKDTKENKTTPKGKTNGTKTTTTTTKKGSGTKPAGGGAKK